MSTETPRRIGISLEQAKALLAQAEKDGIRLTCSAVRNPNREIIAWELPCENGDVVVAPPTTIPWVAHERNTWPHRYMTCKVLVTLRKWNQRHPVDENTTEVVLPVGTRVKIVMVSRFGDVGITDDLTAENGYHARIPLDELDAKFENFSMEA